MLIVILRTTRNKNEERQKIEKERRMTKEETNKERNE